jgi:hypothetical protein
MRRFSPDISWGFVARRCELHSAEAREDLWAGRVHPVQEKIECITDRMRRSKT